MKGKNSSSSMSTSTAVPFGSKSPLKSLHICPSCYKTFTNISKLERHYIKSHTPLGTMYGGNKPSGSPMSVNSFYPNPISSMSTSTSYIPQSSCHPGRQGSTHQVKSVGVPPPVLASFESSPMPLSDMTLCHSHGLLGELPTFLPQRNCPPSQQLLNYPTGNNSTLLTHIKSEPHETNLPDTIQEDTTSNTSNSSSSSSQKVYRSETPKTCNVCGKEIRSRRNMKRHMLIHDDLKPYPCTNCEKSFRQASNLKTHVTVVHDDNGNLMCQLCSKIFRHSKNFKRHMLIHEGVKPYSCDRCGKEFRQAVHLKTHMVTHDGHKPYSCNTCGKSFGRVANLKRHMLIHDGTKPFACQICQKHFTQAGHLKNHIIKCRDRRLFTSFQV